MGPHPNVTRDPEAALQHNAEATVQGTRTGMLHGRVGAKENGTLKMGAIQGQGQAGQPARQHQAQPEAALESRSAQPMTGGIGKASDSILPCLTVSYKPSAMQKTALSF